jgi:hypothetical protein
MNIKPRNCANCHHFRPAAGFVPNECAMENSPAPAADDFCDEHQTEQEATAAQAEAIARGAILKARCFP